MAVTPLTPTEVDGALDVQEIRVYHRTGALQGQTLVVAIDDADLATDLQAGDIEIENLRTDDPLYTPTP